jgi:hypothetical protein
MAVNYNITANVVDITVDQPQKTDSFVVDSNVWFWFAYTKASMSAYPYQVIDYPAYLKHCLSVGANLIKTGL